MIENWSLARVQNWAAEHPWIMGVNYVPSSAVNSTECWQEETFDPKTIAKELALLADTGFNSCRVFLQELVWEHDAEGFKERFSTFLRLAASVGLSVMPVLFDDCAFDKAPPCLGKQPEPVPGRMMTHWTASPGHARALDQAQWPLFARYVSDMLGSFGQDNRILLWDLYNEPGNEGMGDRALPLLQAAFDWARAAAPMQPLTAGVWNFGQEWQSLNDYQLAASDVLSFHSYGDLAEITTRLDELTRVAAGRPLYCTEWMARPLGSRIATHLPLFKERQVGCYLWGGVNGRTQTHLCWDIIKDQYHTEEWFHDLFHADGTPYDESEITLLRELSPKTDNGTA